MEIQLVLRLICGLPGPMKPPRPGCPNHSSAVQRLRMVVVLHQQSNSVPSKIQTPRRKPPVDEKASHKDESKIHKPARKITTIALAPPAHADKALNKHPPTLKRSYGVLNNPNAANLVHIPPNSKTLIDATNSST